jgi:cell division septation protein DedD
MRGHSHIRIRGLARGVALGAVLGCAGLSALVAPEPARAHGSYSPYDETASTALGRYVRALADNPQDFNSLIGAGRAAIALGDPHAAGGFFARADEVNPRSPLPQSGMGAVAVLNGEPHAALPYFNRAQQLGAPVSTFALDRGLAYDLLGRQAEAQADYRIAMTGRDSDEARRRLALSLAISGNRAEALQWLGPLMAKGDAAAARSRAFVMALTGDPNGARIAIDAAMPGNWSSVEPFIRRIATLRPGDKAAAVNLGIFPEGDGSGFAVAGALVPAAPFAGGDRLASIEQMFGPQSPAAAQPAPRPVTTAPAPTVRYAAATPVKKIPVRAASASTHKKLWLQLASGPNAEALPDQFRRLKSRHRDLFDGISGYVAKSGDKARLVIGPFRGRDDAEVFAEDLDSIGVDAFSWTNSPSDRIVPLGTE